jgi:hypothetical protein
MATIYLRGANITAQWYADNYPGTTFPRLEKFLLHTTETGGWPGYSAGASAPNATYYPKFRQIRQHFGINRSARALRDPSSTAVRENRDNVFQLEIICYSDYRLAVERGGIWVGDLTDTHMRDIAAMILQCHRDWDLPIQSSVTWREGRKTYYNDVRLAGSQFDAYRGILGHVHASGNDHWDPGGFRYSKLKAALSWQLVNHPVYGGGTTIPDPTVPGGTLDPKDWFDMATLGELKQVVRDVLAEGGDATPYIDGSFQSRDTAIRRASVNAGNAVNAIKYQVLPELAALRAMQVDVDALAAAIVGKLPNAGSASIDKETVKQGLIEVLTEGVGVDAPA